MSPRKASGPADVDLVVDALGGDQEAHRQLVLRYQRPVFALIRRMLRDSATAEDLTQDVFVKAFRALASYDRRRKFSSWLFKIAHNTAIDQLRRRQLDTVALETPGSSGPDLVAFLPDSQAASPDERMQRRDLAGAIEGAIALLRPEYREVVVLRYQQDLSYEEIAEVMDLPLGTVKTHLHRARKAMAQHLAARGWAPEGG